MEVEMEIRKSNGMGYLTAKWPLDPDRTTLVFIHGAGGTGAFWQDQVEGLAAWANTIALDLPGHGTSDGAAKDDIGEYAQPVADFINDVKPFRPVVCGLSLGGAIALQLLLDFPDLVKAGILISTGAKLRVAPEIFDAIENDFNGFSNMMVKLAVSQATDADRVERFKQDLEQCGPEVLLADFGACDRFDVMQRVASITLPVLIVTAEDDQVTPPKYGDFLGDSISNARRVHIGDAGHIVPLEKPEAVNRAIADFLKEKNWVDMVDI
jgi:pimeloyl-ACP methyl ester carboxylesterase